MPSQSASPQGMKVTRLLPNICTDRSASAAPLENPAVDAPAKPAVMPNAADSGAPLQKQPVFTAMGDFTGVSHSGSMPTRLSSASEDVPGGYPHA